jgi:hypothetical protein
MRRSKAFINKLCNDLDDPYKVLTKQQLAFAKALGCNV